MMRSEIDREHIGERLHISGLILRVVSRWRMFGDLHRALGEMGDHEVVDGSRRTVMRDMTEMAGRSQQNG